MGRSHLEASRTKFHVHVAILNDGNASVYQWNNGTLSLQVGKSWVVWIDANRHIGHDGFWAGGGDG